jgi:purine-binding chemotaxis protein CheW
MSEKEEIKINHYLTFKLSDETFASHVNHVTKILEMQKITEVPRAPEFMKGVINLRGNVLPIIDGRIKFGMTPKPYTDKTCILVLNVQLEGEQVEVGAIVDAVLDVIEFAEENIKPSPALGSKYKSDFIDGVIKLNEEFIMILNMDSVFSAQEIIELKTGEDTEHAENTDQENKKENQNTEG